MYRSFALLFVSTNTIINYLQSIINIVIDIYEANSFDRNCTDTSISSWKYRLLTFKFRIASFHQLPASMGTVRISLTLPPNIDPTRATLAYGNWAPARLKRELEDDALKTRQLAVFALSEYLHDPENIASMLHVGVISSLKQLLQDADETCRKLAADCVATMNTHAIGRQGCVAGGLLEPLEELLLDEDEECRLTAHRAINRLCESVEGCLAVIENKSLLPIMESVIEEDIDSVKLLAVESMSNILMADVGPAHEQILDTSVFDIVSELINHHTLEMQLKATSLLVSLTFSRKAKEIIRDSYMCILESVAEHLICENWKMKSLSALALSNICMFAKTKRAAIILGSIKHLYFLVHSRVSEVRSNVLAALTRLAEHPVGRIEALRYIKHLEPLLNDPVPRVRKQAKILVKVITWKP